MFIYENMIYIFQGLNQFISSCYRVYVANMNNLI